MFTETKSPQTYIPFTVSSFTMGLLTGLGDRLNAIKQITSNEYLFYCRHTIHLKWNAILCTPVEYFL